MEGSGKGGSSSSISSQLFGTTKGGGSSPSSGNANSSSSSSSKVFDSVFSTSPTPEKKKWYAGRETSRAQFGSWRKQESEHQFWNSKQGSSGNTNQSKEGKEGGGGGSEGHTGPNKDRSSIFHDETVEQPCYLSSSLYYGGQDMYSNPSNARTSGAPPPIFKKDGGSGENDPNENSASRGNWWQGSLYY